MTTYYITVSNGLLEKHHHDQMGNAIWLYLWFIDKITKIDLKQLGWVLGGKPLQVGEIPHMSRRTVQRHLATLKKYGYIEIVYTPRGFIVKVTKAKKKFGRPTTELAHHASKVAHHRDNYGAPRVKSGAPNKTPQYDTPVDSSEDTGNASKEARGNPNKKNGGSWNSFGDIAKKRYDL